MSAIERSTSIADCKLALIAKLAIEDQYHKLAANPLPFPYHFNLLVLPPDQIAVIFSLLHLVPFQFNEVLDFLHRVSNVIALGNVHAEAKHFEGMGRSYLQCL
jgi:hypothetical protein